MKRFDKKTILFAAAGLLVLIGLIAGVCALVSRRPAYRTLAQAGLADEADVTLIADHGLSALEPANTTAALARAGEGGCDGVHFEVRRTADGIWVVLQNRNIRRTTNGSGRIDKITYKQLLRYRINRGRGVRQYRDDPLRVPTLEQALAACSQAGLTPVIDVKQSGTDCLESLFGAVGYRFRKECRFVFSDDEQLRKAEELLESGSSGLKKENVRLCRFVSKLNKKALEEAKKSPDVTVCFASGKTGSVRQIRRFTQAGLTLCAWNVKKPKQIKKLADAGVTQFVTDRLVRQEIVTDEPEETTAKTKKKPTTAPAEETAKPTEKPAATQGK